MNNFQLYEQQKGAKEHAAKQEAEAFRSYSTEQDQRLDEMMKGVSVRDQQRATAEIIAGLKEYGIEPAEFMRMYSTDRTMRHAAFQRMMFEAGAYRAMMKAGKVAATKILPPVMRPGAAGDRPSFAGQSTGFASKAFQEAPTAKNAAALLMARRAARS